LLSYFASRRLLHVPATLEHIAYRVRLAASVAMDGSTFVAAFCTLTILYAAAWVVIGKLMQGPPL